MLEGYDGGASAVREGAARNVNDINNAGNEFFGAKTPDYLRDKVRQERLIRNNLDLGRGLSEAKQNELGFKNAGYMSLGGATAPQLVQTGGSMTSQGSGTVSSPFLNQMGGSFASSLGSGLGQAGASLAQ